MTRDLVSGHFVGAPGRRIFMLLREPAGGRGDGCVLVVPPFGEEMNKARRMIAATARRLSEAGAAVVVPDLAGTGDSEGEFRDARVETWLEDLQHATHLAEQRGHRVRAVLAVRLGCALAAAALRRGLLPAVERSVWWQPVLDGRRYLTQFLRLRVAAASMRGGATETVEDLRARAAGGETIAVAGYELSPALLRGLDDLVVEAIPAAAGQVAWLEFVREATDAPPLPVTRLVERSRAAGAQVEVTTLAAEPFWTSAETVLLPQLVASTADLLCAARAGDVVATLAGSGTGR